MEQFLVPQFIDVEDKIIGPFTTRQFLIMLFGGLTMFIEFKLSDFTLFVLEGVFTLVVVGVFAFLKINGMPFHYFVVNFIQTLRRPRVRVWRKTITEDELSHSVQKALHPVAVHEAVKNHRTLPPSRLQELSLLVDTGGAYRPEEELSKDTKF